MEPSKKKALGDDSENVDEKLKALEAELANMKDIAARAQADLQNAKDRLQREADDLRRFAVAGIIMRLLPTVDNFQRAFAHLPAELATHDWIKGVQAMEQDLIKILSDAGLTKIDSLGQPVDPAKHEVLQTGPGEQGKVVEVFEDGYELNGKILRVAKVKVGDGN